MKVKHLNTSLLFECKEVKQETLIDALDFFIERLKKLGVELHGIYPGDPFSLPFAMYLSNKLSVPIKTENFAGKNETLLLLFSALPFELITKRYVAEKTLVFRREFPNSPSLLILSKENAQVTDFQLIKSNFGRFFSYQFLREARENFFWPLDGEVTSVSERLWELSKKEISNFIKAKRIRDSARKYLKEGEITNLKLVDSDIDLSVWEKFKKLKLINPQIEGRRGENEKISVEKLFQIKNPSLSSAVTSLLEYIAQSLEYQFPTYVAYSNAEITDRRGILVIPKVTEELSGADLKVEVILKEEKIEEKFKKAKLLIKNALLELLKDVLKNDFFKPHIDSILEKELNRGTIYLNWFIDNEMAEKINKKINKRWLLTRLLYRKKIKSEFSELVKLLRNFEFNIENYETLKGKMGSLWRKNRSLFKAKADEIVEAIESRKLWPLIGTVALIEKALREPLNFLIGKKGYENHHHLLASLNTYYTPVITKRIYRPNWERTIKEEIPISIKGEPLNPYYPKTFILQTEDGKFLGTLPKAISHYIFSKERQGKRIECRELYFEPDIFSENSYWIEVRCL